MLYQGIIGGGSSPVEPVDLSPVLLWTNPSPTSEFAGQKVSLDLSEYAGVIIEFMYKTDTQVIKTKAYGLIGDNDLGAGTLRNDGNPWGRNYSVSSTGVTFTNGSYSNDNNAPNLLIPYKIYGFKEYLVKALKPVDATICERAYNFPATSGTTNTWTVNKDGLYLVGGTAPSLEDSRGSITFIGEATLISGSDAIRVFTAKAGAQIQLTVASGNTFTPYINIIK